MTTEEFIDEIKKMLANTASQLRSGLLNNDPISYLHWLNVAHGYLNLYKAIPTAPELVELADSLLNASVELDSDYKGESYRVICSYIKRLSATEDYGSKGTSTL